MTQYICDICKTVKTKAQLLSNVDTLIYYAMEKLHMTPFDICSDCHKRLMTHVNTAINEIYKEIKE